MASNGGLLRQLSGKPRIKAWRSPHLLACALPGPVSHAPHDLRHILENKDPNYYRERPVAVINANDVSSPSHVTRASSTCEIKMSTISLEGLRQAFLDPDSRIRLSTDSQTIQHHELVSLAFSGGFLKNTIFCFSSDLNVLIGGRGTGKSTVIEAIRYVLDLDIVGEDAQNAYLGIVKNVLQSGTKISLRLRLHQSIKTEYVIERTVHNPPIVRDNNGRILRIHPREILPNVEVYGQHEISELTKSGEHLT